jgi:uncharacterized protein YjiS (DUF1127 family)
MTARSLPRPVLLEPAIGFSAGPHHGPLTTLARLLSRRRERLALADLLVDHRLLDDIAVEETAARREVAKPFWRP